MSAETDRRPIASRNTRWAQRAAARLADRGVTPNQISVASMGMAMLSYAAYSAIGDQSSLWAIRVLCAIAILGIILRLLCNLLDGMVAVEHGKGSPLGMIYNELPDRISDTLIIVGFALMLNDHGATRLGFGCAMMAIIMSYIRVLGAYAGARMTFQGPMDKSRRMAMLIAITAVIFIWPGTRGWLVESTLIVLFMFVIIGCWNRLSTIAIDLKAKAEAKPGGDS